MYHQYLRLRRGRYDQNGYQRIANPRRLYLTRVLKASLIDNHKALDVRRDRWLTVLVMGYSLGLSAWLLVNGVHVTFDDGFYYFKIAQHVAQGAGSSFDGLTVTTGYHPLWLWCLIPVFLITPEAGTALLLGGIVQALVTALGAALVYRAARLLVGRPAAVLAVLVWIWLTYPVALSGMEFSLHALGVLTAAYVYLRRFTPALPEPIRPYLTLGLVLSLTMLARVDTMLLASVLGLHLAWREGQRRWSREGVRRLLAFGLPLALAGVAVGVINVVLSGHLAPISGVVKQEWSVELLAADPRYAAHGWVVAKLYHLTTPLRQVEVWYYRPIVLGVFGAVGVWSAGGLAPRRHAWGAWFAQALRPWSPFVLYGGLSFLSYALIYHQSLSYSAWYYVVQSWVAAMLAATLAEYLRRQARWATAVLAVMTVGVFLLTARGLLTWRAQEQADPTRLLYHDAARWTRANLPADAVIGSWNAGTLGYLSQRRVVNLDGVVNSWAYHETDRHDLCRYWDAMGITHLIDVFEENRALSAVPTFPAYAPCANRLDALWIDNRYHPSWSLRAYRIRPGPDP